LAIKYLDAKRIRGSSTGAASFTPAGSFNVRYLVVGGGAGTGTNNGGGGGAGGFKTNASYGVTAQSYEIIVGAKSLGQRSVDGSGNPQTNPVANGGDSTFGDIVSAGGGGGGNQVWNNPAEYGGSDGASGGGGGYNGVGGDGISGQGYDGGDGVQSGGAGGGGGGGSAGVGTNAATSGGNGGAGTNSDITGSTVNHAAGGGGASQAGSAGQGGNNDAGDGNRSGSGDADDATTTTATSSAGNGGGGGRGAGYGGDGSDGIVIIRFDDGESYTKSGGVLSSDNGDTIITYLVGNSSIDDKTNVTNVPDGTIFEQTDDHTYHLRKGGAWTSEDNISTNGEYLVTPETYSDTTNWTQPYGLTEDYASIDTTNKRADLNYPSSSTANSGKVFRLPHPLSARWILRFQVNISSLAGNDFYFLSLTENDDRPYGDSQGNSLSCQVQGASYNRFTLGWRVMGEDSPHGEHASSSNVWNDGTEYYCELSRGANHGDPQEYTFRVRTVSHTGSEVFGALLLENTTSTTTGNASRIHNTTLKYLQHTNRGNGNGSYIVGYVREVYLKDGVSIW